ncbi:MAG: hypothetical protein KDA24_09620 [Deltaproteobacteria bacterium]|nr:hypothetical protein [Deltaproteobacteria bacterium]
MPEHRARTFLEEYRAGDARRRRAMRSEAAGLARSTHRAGVDLCMSKATEFSPRIKVLFGLAAKLAVLADDIKGDELARFQRDGKDR